MDVCGHLRAVLFWVPHVFVMDRSIFKEIVTSGCLERNDSKSTLVVNMIRGVSHAQKKLPYHHSPIHNPHRVGNHMDAHFFS
jgi:hypothetical protein